MHQVKESAASNNILYDVSDEIANLCPDIKFRLSNSARASKVRRHHYSPDDFFLERLPLPRNSLFSNSSAAASPTLVSLTPRPDERDSTALHTRMQCRFLEPPSQDSSPLSVFSGRSSPESTSSADTGLPVTTEFPKWTHGLNLYLPNEENHFAGFCQGAWKQQLGLSKAFSIHLRPAGMFDSVPYWKCSKCSFHGPVQGSDDRSTWKFDQRVHVHQPTGIRYRWSFLAKSHIEWKRTLVHLHPETDDGSEASFGCIFCCVELRGPAPVFGDLASFMEHLWWHRGRDLPQTLLGRTPYIIGRRVEDWEDFDVNIP